MRIKSVILVAVMFPVMISSKAPDTTCSKVVAIFNKDKYKCLQEKMVGSGASAAAFMVTEESTHLTRLIKVQSISADLAKVKARKEIAFLTRLSHSNIIKVIENKETDSLMATVLEYAEKGALDGIISSGKPFLATSREVLEFMRQLMEAVEYMHSQKVVHADLKPANIIVTKDNIPIIIDFDLAVDLDTVDRARGSPIYMAPEVLFGGSIKYEPTVDIYSLGVIFYELISGKVPFDGDTIDDIGDSIEVGNIPIQKNTDVIVAYVIVSCLQLKPARRHPLKKLIAEVQEYIKEEKFLVMPEKQRFSNEKRLVKSNLLESVGIAPGGNPNHQIGKRALSQSVRAERDVEVRVPSDLTKYQRIVLQLIFVFGIVISTLFLIFWKVFQRVKDALINQASAVNAKATGAQEDAVADKFGTLRTSISN
jgi:serine/threonine protein kinase